MKLWAKQKMLLCPVCGKPYEYCHGQIKVPYFRHADKAPCISLYSEPETDEHLLGKKDLFEWVQKQPGVTDVVLEGWLPDSCQRPDIMFKYNNKQCVIEYQCTPIATEYFTRHSLYREAGIHDVWICGAKKYFQRYHSGSGNKRMSEFEEWTRKYYDPSSKMLFFLDEELPANNSDRQREKRGFNHINEDFNNYNPWAYNIYPVKDPSINFRTTSYFISRRKGYGTDVEYVGNRVFAYCKRLEDVCIKGGE